jgi:flagellar motor switch protein FliM
MVPTFDREARAVAPIIEEMFLNVGRRLRARLATSTGLDSPITVKAVRPTGLANLLEGEAWSDAALWATYAHDEGAEPVVVAVDSMLLNRMTGPLLGQGAVDDPSAVVPHPVTPVELRLGARFTKDLIDAMESSWTVGAPPALRMVEVAPSRRVCGDLDPALSFAVCTVEVALGGSPIGCAHVALPNALVRRLLPRALGGAGSAAVPERAQVARPAPRPAQFDRVMPVEVEVAVELARINIPLKRLEGLRVGDEVLVGRAGEAVARIGDLAVFAGEPGASGSVRSVRVTSKMISDFNTEAVDR